MIVRIVKMNFKQEEMPNFILLFNEIKSSIAAFKGCQHLTLYKDREVENCVYTYSIWDNEEALNNYRNSDLFKKIWPETKAMFSNKAMAWSYEPTIQ